jgi:hypothetical protein
MYQFGIGVSCGGEISLVNWENELHSNLLEAIGSPISKDDVSSYAFGDVYIVSANHFFL